MSDIDISKLSKINNTILQIMDISTKVIIDGEIVKTRDYVENPNDMIMTIINTQVNKIHTIVGKDKLSLWATVKAMLSMKNLSIVLM